MRIQDIITESARTNRVCLTESQINEIVEIFGHNLTEAQLQEIAGGNFLKKLVITAATAAALLGGTVAHGHEVSPGLQSAARQTVAVQKAAKSDPGRYQEIAAKLNDQRQVSQVYSIELSNTGGPAVTQVFTQPRGSSIYEPSGRTELPSIQCKITVNPKYLDNLSDNAVAWVLGHEMAHCELKHKGNHLNPNANWDQEYSADQLGAKLAKQAGYNPDSAYKEMSFLHQHQKEIKADYQSATHPDYSARVTNLGGGQRQQASIMKTTGAAQANKIAQNPNGSISLKERSRKG